MTLLWLIAIFMLDLEAPATLQFILLLTLASVITVALFDSSEEEETE